MSEFNSNQRGNSGKDDLVKVLKYVYKIEDESDSDTETPSASEKATPPPAPEPEVKEIIKKKSRLDDFMLRFSCSSWEPTFFEAFLKEFIEKFITNGTNSSEDIEELELHLPNILYGFHFRNESLKLPLQLPGYLEKMSKMVAFSSDLKFKKAKETMDKNGKDDELIEQVANDVLTSFFTYLKKSLENILDAVLMMDCMTEDYRELAVLVLRRVLRDPPSMADCLTHARLVLVSRLLTRLSPDSEKVQLKKPRPCSKRCDPVKDHLGLVLGTAKLFGSMDESEIDKEEAFNKIVSRCFEDPESKNLVNKLPLFINESRKARISARKALLRSGRVPLLEIPEAPKNIFQEKGSSEAGSSQDVSRPDESSSHLIAGPSEPAEQSEKKVKQRKNREKSMKMLRESPLNTFLCKALGESNPCDVPVKSGDKLPFKFIDILNAKRKRDSGGHSSSSKEETVEAPTPPQPPKVEEPPPVTEMVILPPLSCSPTDEIDVSPLVTRDPLEEQSFIQSLELSAMCNSGFEILEADDGFDPFLPDLF